MQLATEVVCIEKRMREAQGTVQIQSRLTPSDLFLVGVVLERRWMGVACKINGDVITVEFGKDTRMELDDLNPTQQNSVIQVITALQHVKR